MLLLTDRLTEISRLHRLLSSVEPCTAISVHQGGASGTLHSVIVCDVAFDQLSSITATHEALTRHRPQLSTPLLCMARDPSQLTANHAKAIGATTIVPHDAPHAQIVQTLHRLVALQRPEPAHGDGARQEIKTNVEQAGSALSHLLGAAKGRTTISMAALERGGNAVIAAVGQAKIRAWLEIVRNYDDVTFQHCLLVAGLAAAFAPRLGLSLGGQRLVSQAALIHDIGKAQIPWLILNKPGELSSAEMAVMRTHPAAGSDMLGKQGGFDPQLLDVVRHHHECLDGSGYPDGLRGVQISPFVRLVTICDIYAALIERRSYKAPLPQAKALSILVDMGAKLDTSLLGVFHRVVSET